MNQILAMAFLIGLAVGGFLGMIITIGVLSLKLRKVRSVAQTLLLDAANNEGGRISPSVAIWAARRLKVLE